MQEIPKFEPVTPDNTTRVEVYTDSIVFNARRPDGTVEASASVELADLVRRASDGDPIPLLLWAMFMQMNRMNSSIETAHETALNVDPYDPEMMMSRMGPVVGMVTKLMEKAGINPEHIQATSEAFAEIGAKTGEHVPELQPSGAVRKIGEE